MLRAVSGCTVFNQSVLTPNLTITINKTGVCGENLVYVIVITMENVIGETVSLNTTICELDNYEFSILLDILLIEYTLGYFID